MPGANFRATRRLASFVSSYEGASFDRIGPSAGLVKQNERRRREDLHNGDDVLHVSREGGQALRQRLRIPNVRKNAAKNRQAIIFRCWNEQSALRHQT